MHKGKQERNQNCAGAPGCKQRIMLVSKLMISFFSENSLFPFADVLAFRPDFPDFKHNLL